MPESSRHSANTEQDLDAQVESLVRQAETAGAGPEEAAAATRPNEPGSARAVPPHVGPEPSGQSPHEAPGDEACDPQTLAEAAVDDLDGHIADLSGQIDALLEEPAPEREAVPVQEPSPVRPASAPPQDSPAANSSLDEQLASLTNELIEGEFSDSDGQTIEAAGPTPVSADAAAPANEPPAPRPASSSAANSSPALAPAPPAQTPVDDDSTLARTSAPRQPKAVAPPPPPARPPEANAVPAAPVAEARTPAPASTASAARRKGARGNQAALAVAGAINKPLLSRPRIVRDMIGWVALWTLFLFACAVIYLVFFRSTTAPSAEPTGTSIAGAPE